MNKADIVKEYLNKWHDLSSHALAKLLVKDYPALFLNAELARNQIRYFRGVQGKRSRKYGIKIVRDYYAYLPNEESENNNPYILDVKHNRIGIISDIHIPNHRNKAINLAYKYFEENKANTIIINGDLLDNTPYTNFLTPPDKKDAKKYLEKAEFFLESLRDIFPDARIIWAEGNHDFWYYQYLMKKAPELYGDEYYHLSERLNLKEYKIDFVPQTRYIMIGKLAICHGHYLVRGIFTPVSAARTVMLKAKVPVIIGHVHQTSEYTDTDLHGNICTTWSTGCLCTLTPDYMPMGGKANHGFAFAEINKDGSFSVTNKRILNDKIL